MQDEEDGGVEEQRRRRLIKLEGVPRRGILCSWLSALLFLAIAGLGFFAASIGTGASSRRILRARSSSDADEYIVLACHATLYPEVCVSAITADPRSRKGFTSPDQLLRLAVDLASQVTSQSLNLTAGILDRAGGNKNLTAATRDCVQVLSFGMNRYRNVEQSGFSRSAAKDTEAWLSAILAYQYDCFSALGYVNSSTEVQRVMLQVNSGMVLISNVLSMTDAWDLYGDNVSNWKPPPSKRDEGEIAPHQNWSASDWIQETKEVDRRPQKLSVVGKSGGAFKSIQEAIDSAPNNSKERFIIHIEEGIYEEHIYVSDSKTSIMLVGAGAGKTIISGSNYVREGVTTMDTATLLVAGDGFVAQNLTVRNTAGPDAHQAVAVRLNSDKTVFRSCSLEGFQDTLYSHTQRHYFEDCTIAGTVDFIFGNSAAFFSNCKLIVRPGRKGIYNSMVTAHGRIDPGQTTGFVFHKCSVETSQGFPVEGKKKLQIFLGRPWKMFSRAVFLESYLGNSVSPQGWLAWTGDFALQTLLFAEYESYGPGADPAQRVWWSTQLTSSQVPAFSAENFIQGDGWIIQSSSEILENP